MENNTKITLKVTSSAFNHEGMIPAKYTCEGEEVNPPLQIDQIPSGTRSLVIIMEDPDAPNGTFDHWLVWNIPPASAMIGGDSVPGICGKNGGGNTGYYGPCPPSGQHRYFINVYALDTMLELEGGADKAALRSAMEGHIVAEGVLMGKYGKTGL
ncbi:YbhB/YbcL family Raf kinase inhibitor-like protein [Chitinophaga rhizophila]|uniref:YbhB/YbcL family Raf kinase inhibitor-like protein n=1 Tax=Chitinophaga rhizophila TaxID=2866212 RepID=A0ABS7GB80_9BACT|nr:YbhB/YbcL family Raf kinase inhibitor-like protein [Chitinophaga rhizophila]MBW8684586.1 YbhB/YbcL family Raf kinase inhibitor-like protein [Chitinophaga rhizophila]